MKRKRTHLTDGFEARAALEALQEEKTIRRIAIDGKQEARGMMMRDSE